MAGNVRFPSCRSVPQSADYRRPHEAASGLRTSEDGRYIEERALLERFGPQFVDYRETVRRWLQQAAATIRQCGRWVVLLLLALMPVHLSWAAMNVCCEQVHAEQSLDLHNDLHEDQGVAPTPALNDAEVACNVCHACCAAAVSSAVLSTPVHRAAHAVPWQSASSLSVFSSEPERPNWADLA